MTKADTIFQENIERINNIYIIIIHQNDKFVNKEFSKKQTNYEINLYICKKRTTKKSTSFA